MGINLLESYTTLFEQHVYDTRLHITGALQSDDDDNEGQIFLPLHIPKWTEEENNTFFHALSIHSRLRPDLIAEYLPDKCTADVSLYIDFLDKQEPLSIHQSFASESSPHFIKKEERQAKALQAAEQGPLLTHVDEDLEEEFASILIDIDQSVAQAIDRILDTDNFGIEDNDEIEESDMDVDGDEQSRSNNERIDQDIGGPSAASSESTEDLTGSLLQEPLSLSRQSSVQSNLTTSEQGSSTSSVSSNSGQEPGVLKIMTPAERRRHNKKMYMRRKRGIADEGVGNLTAGRKRKSLGSKTPSISNSEDSNDNQGVAVVEESSIEGNQKTQENQSHTTAIDEIFQKLQGMGITAQSFIDMDMDLFHLHSLLSLKREEKPHISAAVFRLLNGFVVDYVYELVRHSIIARELEVDIKRSDDWGIYHRSELTKSAVLTAIAIVDQKRQKAQEELGLVKRTHCFGATLPMSYESDEDDLMSETTDIEALETDLSLEKEREADDEVADEPWDVWISQSLDESEQEKGAHFTSEV